MASRRRLAIPILAAICLLAVACSPSGTSSTVQRPPADTAPAATVPTALPAPTGLGERDLDLRAGPVAEPLELRIPAIDVDAEVLGVGMTSGGVMDAPAGGADEPSWRQAFWYRGSAVPGEPSTALIAGHIDDPLGRPGVFARLDALRPGDEITVHDTRVGTDVSFVVTTTHSYTLAEAATGEVLDAMYGAGPVAGTWPQPSPDGISHLSLVTCAGTYRDGTHDHRLLVRAVRRS